MVKFRKIVEVVCNDVPSPEYGMRCELWKDDADEPEAIVDIDRLWARENWVIRWHTKGMQQTIVQGRRKNVEFDVHIDTEDKFRVMRFD